MARGQEETSTSGRPGGRLRVTPSTISIISSLTMEELMTYCEVLDNIDLQLMDRTDESTLGGEHNGVFFTREYLATGLHFLVPALVNSFCISPGRPWLLSTPTSLVFWSGAAC